MTRHGSVGKILVIASEPMLAAIVGRFVEAARFHAVFPAGDERPERALTRERPVAAVLVDVTIDDAASDVFLTRARRGGVTIMLFGSRASIERNQAWAAERSVATFVLPEELESFRTALEQLTTSVERGRAEGRRRGSEADRVGGGGGAAGDGVVTFDDATGTRWTVYDRRSGDRRRTVVDRSFVSDSGEVRRCDLTDEEAQAVSSAELKRQLERARPER